MPGFNVAFKTNCSWIIVTLALCELQTKSRSQWVWFQCTKSGHRSSC